MWRLFHLWLRFITFAGRLAHLAYRVHKSGRKISIVIILQKSAWAISHKSHTGMLYFDQYIIILETYYTLPIFTYEVKL